MLLYMYMYLPTLTPVDQKLWSHAHSYGLISHASLENMGCCNHIWRLLTNVWKICNICKRVICTQTNNRLKSAVNDRSSGEYSSVFKWEEVVLGKGYPGIENRKSSEQFFGNVRVVFVNFWKVFWAFSDIMSEVIPEILIKISRLCVRKSLQVYVHDK